jgi:copper chaperone
MTPTELVLRVEGMSCGHCERAVTAAIKALDPAAAVAVDLAAGTVRATTALPRATVVDAVVEEGYRVVS